MKLVNKSIVLDLDGVIADIDKSVSNYLQQDGSVDDPSYAEWFTTNTKSPEALKLFGNSLFWKNIKPFSDAFFQINYWANIGYEINVVTARRQEASVKEAMPWLNKWHIEIHEIYFAEYGKKIDIVKNETDNINQKSDISKSSLNLDISKSSLNLDNEKK